jgi:hypothetical protein
MFPAVAPHSSGKLIISAIPSFFGVFAPPHDLRKDNEIVKPMQSVTANSPLRRDAQDIGL